MYYLPGYGVDGISLMLGKEFKQGTCPACGISWQGQEIPGEHRHLYGEDSTHFSRVIGVEYSHEVPEHYDGMSEYRCPDCGARFGRWSGRQLAEGEAEPYGGIRPRITKGDRVRRPRTKQLKRSGDSP
jgi:predicted RNA-binding Zn-ribbon protein involved in translation (DUF1610 family)